MSSNQFSGLNVAIRKMKWSQPSNGWLHGGKSSETCRKVLCTWPWELIPLDGFSRARAFEVSPRFSDTWLVGPLMATGSATLNNGRLRHNHPQQEEDSLWPHHLSLLIRKPSERERESQRHSKRERKRMRGKIEQITVWTQRPKWDRGSDWGWG